MGCCAAHGVPCVFTQAHRQQWHHFPSAPPPKERVRLRSPREVPCRACACPMGPLTTAGNLTGRWLRCSSSTDSRLPPPLGISHSAFLSCFSVRSRSLPGLLEGASIRRSPQTEHSPPVPGPEGWAARAHERCSWLSRLAPAASGTVSSADLRCRPGAIPRQSQQHSHRLAAVILVRRPPGQVRRERRHEGMPRRSQRGCDDAVTMRSRGGTTSWLKHAPRGFRTLRAWHPARYVAMSHGVCGTVTKQMMHSRDSVVERAFQTVLAESQATVSPAFHQHQQQDLSRVIHRLCDDVWIDRDGVAGALAQGMQHSTSAAS